MSGLDKFYEGLQKDRSLTNAKLLGGPAQGDCCPYSIVAAMLVAGALGDPDTRERIWGIVGNLYKIHILSLQDTQSSDIAQLKLLQEYYEIDSEPQVEKFLTSLKYNKSNYQAVLNLSEGLRTAAFASLFEKENMDPNDILAVQMTLNEEINVGGYESGKFSSVDTYKTYLAKESLEVNLFLNGKSLPQSEMNDPIATLDIWYNGKDHYDCVITQDRINEYTKSRLQETSSFQEVNIPIPEQKKTGDLPNSEQMKVNANINNLEELKQKKNTLQTDFNNWFAIEVARLGSEAKSNDVNLPENPLGPFNQISYGVKGVRIVGDMLIPETSYYETEFRKVVANAGEDNVERVKQLYVNVIKQVKNSKEYKEYKDKVDALDVQVRSIEKPKVQQVFVKKIEPKYAEALLAYYLGGSLISIDQQKKIIFNMRNEDFDPTNIAVINAALIDVRKSRPELTKEQIIAARNAAKDESPGALDKFITEKRRELADAISKEKAVVAERKIKELEAQEFGKKLYSLLVSPISGQVQSAVNPSDKVIQELERKNKIKLLVEKVESHNLNLDNIKGIIGVTDEINFTPKMVGLANEKNLEELTTLVEKEKERMLEIAASKKAEIDVFENKKKQKALGEELYYLVFPDAKNNIMQQINMEMSKVVKSLNSELAKGDELDIEKINEILGVKDVTSEILVKAKENYEKSKEATKSATPGTALTGAISPPPVPPPVPPSRPVPPALPSLLPVRKLPTVTPPVGPPPRLPSPEEAATYLNMLNAEGETEISVKEAMIKANVAYYASGKDFINTLTNISKAKPPESIPPATIPPATTTEVMSSTPPQSPLATKASPIAPNINPDYFEAFKQFVKDNTHSMEQKGTEFGDAREITVIHENVNMLGDEKFGQYISQDNGDDLNLFHDSAPNNILENSKDAIKCATYSSVSSNTIDPVTNSIVNATFVIEEGKDSKLYEATLFTLQAYKEFVELPGNKFEKDSEFVAEINNYTAEHATAFLLAYYNVFQSGEKLEVLPVLSFKFDEASAAAIQEILNPKTFKSKRVDKLLLSDHHIKQLKTHFPPKSEKLSKGGGAGLLGKFSFSRKKESTNNPNGDALDLTKKGKKSFKG